MYKRESSRYQMMSAKGVGASVTVTPQSIAGRLSLSHFFFFIFKRVREREYICVCVCSLHHHRHACGGRHIRRDSMDPLRVLTSKKGPAKRDGYFLVVDGCATCRYIHRRCVLYGKRIVCRASIDVLIET